MSVEIYLIISLAINIVAIAFFGVVPPLVIGYLTLKKAQLMLEEAKAIRAGIPGMMKGKGKLMVDEVIVYLGSDEFLNRIRDSANGALGSKVKEVKKRLMEEHDLSGMPAPVVNVIGKGVSGYIHDYFGVPRKAAESAVAALFRKKKPAGQDDGDVLAIANELGISTNGPEIKQDYIKQ